MTLTVIGSSSEGNAYVLQNEREALLLEAGVNFKKVMQAIDYNPAKVQGVLITHEHGDHAGHINEALEYGLPVYASSGTIEGAAKYIRSDYRPLAFEESNEGGFCRIQLGGFAVIPFHTEHDANEPTGFLIGHEETGAVLFATDTFYLKNRFNGLSNILIECNYDEYKLERNVINGLIDAERYRRVRAAHMSLENCIRTLKANDLQRVNNIVLIHLSQDNGDAMAFKKAVTQATGKTVTIARPGLTLRLDKTPF